jgi:hypothetical protein
MDLEKLHNCCQGGCYADKDWGQALHNRYCLMHPAVRPSLALQSFISSHCVNAVTDVFNGKRFLPRLNLIS